MMLGLSMGYGMLTRASKYDSKGCAHYILSRPDHCDGNYDQSCDQERECYNISQILADADRSDLLDYMSIYWKDNRGNDPDLWAHEWNKHGTCISTLRTRCYVNYISQQEVVDYFNKTVEIFQKLPSFEVCLYILAQESSADPTSSFYLEPGLFHHMK